MGISCWRYSLSVTVLLVMVVVLSHGVIAMMMTRLSRGPESTVTKEGDTVVMNCTIDYGKTMTRESLKWYRVSNNNVFTVISEDDLIDPAARPATGSYEITGNHREGDYNLRITMVDRRDSGLYHCGFERSPSRNISSLGAELTVVVPPSITSPSCVVMAASDTPFRSFSTSPPPVFSVGDTARLVCLSSGGLPPASLMWKRPGTTSLTGMTTHSNTIDIVIEESDLDVEFTCNAESPALDAPRSCSLVPARRPHVIRIMPVRPVVSLRGGITLSCEAEGVSPDEDAVWQWFFKGNKVPSESDLPRRFSASNDNKSLTIGLVVAADNDAEIVCQLTTANERTGRATTSLQVEGIKRSSSAFDTSTIDFSSVSYDTTTENIGIPADKAPAVKLYLIIVSSIAGVAIAALTIILIAYIFRRHAKTKRRNANSNNNPESNPKPTPDVRPKQMIQVKTPVNRNRQRIDTIAHVSSDGDYTALQREKGSTGDYQSICRSPPTAPRLDLAAAADNEMCWEYEIPYTVDTLNHVKPLPMNITNPDYLEIT